MLLLISILILDFYIIYILKGEVMAGLEDLNKAVDSLINSVQAEIKRVTLDLSNARPTDSQGIQDAIGKLNNLSAQLDAVDPATVTAGVAPTLTSSNVTPENPAATVPVTGPATTSLNPTPLPGNTGNTPSGAAPTTAPTTSVGSTPTK
jgi:hypothetical protein